MESTTVHGRVAHNAIVDPEKVNTLPTPPIEHDISCSHKLAPLGGEDGQMRPHLRQPDCRCLRIVGEPAVASVAVVPGRASGPNNFADNSSKWGDDAAVTDGFRVWRKL